MKQFIISITLTTLIFSCVPYSSGHYDGADLVEYGNKDYSSRIGNVNISIANDRSGFLSNKILLGSGQQLKLSFDLLDEDYTNLYLKIFHCDKYWEKSNLSDLEFLDDFNEINIRDYDFSQTRFWQYVSYFVSIPATRISGNFIAVIYEEGQAKPLISRRFMVYENNVGISASIVLSTGAIKRLSHHGLELELSYAGLDVIDPNTQLYPIYLQNNNWQTAIYNLTPTAHRPDQRFIEYKPFNQENNFPGLNNFRFFDLRATSYRGQNVARVSTSDRGVEAILQPETSRHGLSFGQQLMDDLNGKYYLQNNDPNAKNINSEYVYVNFRLKTDSITSEVYVTGHFNDWQLNERNKLSYSSDERAYIGSLLLKQGFYNYHYWVNQTELPHYYFEGSHFQSENDYEVLVYYRKPGTVYDRIVGYKSVRQ
ncbi:MAG: DUF5103 domain-containing protein [Cyclobacteriaceae bacterium]